MKIRQARNTTLIARLGVASVLLAALGLYCASPSHAASAAQQPSPGPTFNADVAPILYRNCVACHRAGEAGPMPLLTFAAARPWARAIKAKVLAREMPPWDADPGVGEFRNARLLSQSELDTLVAWVDSGALQGPGAPPQPPSF